MSILGMIYERVTILERFVAWVQRRNEVSVTCRAAIAEMELIIAVIDSSPPDPSRDWVAFLLTFRFGRDRTYSSRKHVY